MKKTARFRTFFVTIVLLFNLIPMTEIFGANTASADSIVNNSIILKVGASKALVNGVLKNINENPNVVPYTDRNNITFIPVNFIAENLGYLVSTDFNAEYRKITVSRPNVSSIAMYIGWNSLEVRNGQNNPTQIPMDAAAVMTSEGQAFIPINPFVTYGLGMKAAYASSEGVIIISGYDIGNNSSIAKEAAGTLNYWLKYAEMRDRADALVNYRWIPTTDVRVWNNNYYTYPDGTKSQVFIRGREVRGIPFTLYTSQLGINSQLSLDRYKNLAGKNYSPNYAIEVYKYGSRIGPAYGSCCTAFVCEILGGDFMIGSNARYLSCSGINGSVYAYHPDARLSNVRPGDVLGSSSSGHSIWIAEVRSDGLLIYEQAAVNAVAAAKIIPKVVDKNGYLVHRDYSYIYLSRPKSLS